MLALPQSASCPKHVDAHTRREEGLPLSYRWIPLDVDAVDQVHAYFADVVAIVGEATTNLAARERRRPTLGFVENGTVAAASDIDEAVTEAIWERHGPPHNNRTNVW